MTHPPVDPELLPALELLAVFEGVSKENYHELVSGAETPIEMPDYSREDVTESQVFIPGLNGAPDVRALIHRSTKARTPLPVLLHIHGGGYVFGAPELNAPANTSLAGDLECMVVSVDYRLAPATTAPGSVEDCYAALKWLNDNASELGIDTNRIAVWGESAGGGLAASLTFLTRDRGEYSLCYQILAAPMVDDRTCINENISPHVGKLVWNQTSNHFGWKSLLGTEPGGDIIPPYSVPSRQTDFSGLPPAYIAVGALDLFLEEDIAYANKLLHTGIPTELHVLPGAFHGYEAAIEANLTIYAEAERRKALAKAFGL